jgi:CHASE3 domain sensor protein
VTAAQAGAAAKRGYLRELGLPTMFGAIVLLVSATLLLGANISALRANLAQIAHAQQVLNKISELETGLLGEEMIVRGYALTGDSSFLRMQNSGAHNREIACIELARLMASNPQRADMFQQVMRDVAKHVEIFSGLNGLGPDKAAVVARAIVDPQVRANMRNVRRGLRQLRTAELNDLGARQRDVTEQLGKAFSLAIGIIVTAFVLGGIGIWAAQFAHPQKH